MIPPNWDPSAQTKVAFSLLLHSMRFLTWFNVFSRRDYFFSAGCSKSRALRDKTLVVMEILVFCLQIKWTHFFSAASPSDLC